MGKEKKIKQNPLFAVGGKIGIVAILGIITVSTIIMLILISGMRNIVSTASKENMHSMAQAYAVRLDAPDAVFETYEDYANVLAEVTVEGVPGSYAYLVSSDGTMLYHPNEEKIGNPVENVVVSGVVQDLADGKEVLGEGVEYEYKGAIKYAGYHVLRNTSNILVVTGSEDAAMEEVNQLRTVSILIEVIIGVIVIAILWIIINLISKRMLEITETVHKISDFDYTHNEDLPKLLKRKDEIGKMAVAVQELLDNMREIIGEMNTSADAVTSSIMEVNDISNKINVNSMDNSATTEELAAGMEETSATTVSMEENIQTMNGQAKFIDELAVASKDSAVEVQSRAQHLKEKASKSTIVARETYDTIREKTDQAIEEAKAVEKISELTDVIMQISSQTSLLALNASIEAARAGEAGRGFAVVAGEIGSLADQTSNTVNNIGEIVKEVNITVKNMQDALLGGMEFIEKQVLDDYQTLSDVGNQYDEDATSFKNSMEAVQESIEGLIGIMNDVSEALSGVNSMVAESTTGVTDIADKTSEVVVQTEKNYEYVNQCVENTEKLKEKINQFKC
jgi:methyl-accepting chemotaxis protein